MRLIFKVTAIKDASGQPTQLELTPDTKEPDTLSVLGAGIATSRFLLTIQEPRQADELHKLDQRYQITIEAI